MDINLIELLSQLKCETKLEILSALYFKGNISVGEIVKISNRNRKNVSKQINEMVKSKILSKEIIGRYHMIRINENLQDELKEICEIIIRRFIFEKRADSKGDHNE